MDLELKTLEAVGMNGTTRFVSGNEHWLCDYKKADLEERQKVIDAAKEGCEKSIYILQKAHGIIHLTLGGKQIF